MNNYRILCFGDSITYGAWDSMGGWSDRLKQHCHQYNSTYKVQVFNLGIGGETSRGLLQRIQAEISTRASNNWSFVFVIAVGINDCSTIVHEDQTQVPIDEYQENMRQIINLAKQHTNNILLIGLTPVGDKLISFKDSINSNTVIRNYDSVLSDLAKSMNVSKVEIFEAAMNNQRFIESLRKVDGLHPEDDGHQWLFEQIKPCVLSLIET